MSEGALHSEPKAGSTEPLKPGQVELLALVLQRTLICAAGPWGLRKKEALALLGMLEAEFFPDAENERRREHDEILQGIRRELSR